MDDKVYLSRYSQWNYVTVLTGVKQQEGGGEKIQVHFPNSWPLPPVVWPEYMANGGMLQLGLLAINPCFRGPKIFEMMLQLWQDVILRASKSSVFKSWNEGLKCQHKHQRSRVWPLGSAIPSIRPELGFLGQGGMLIALVPKAKTT